MTFEQQIYLVLIGAVINGVVLFMLQNWIKRKISEDLVRLENRLETELIVKTAKILNLHETQVNILKTIYNKVLFIRKKIDLLLGPMPRFETDGDLGVMHRELFDIVFEFKDYYENNRVFLPKELIRFIDDILETFQNFRVSLYLLSYGTENKEKLDLPEDEIDGLYDSFSNEGSQLKVIYHALITDFEVIYRKIIGLDITAPFLDKTS